jgi:hypothetical protein
MEIEWINTIEQRQRETHSVMDSVLMAGLMTLGT